MQPRAKSHRPVAGGGVRVREFQARERVWLSPDNPFLLTIVRRRSLTGKTLNRRNSDEEARDVWDFCRDREPGRGPVAAGAKEDIHDEGARQQGAAKPECAATKKTRYRGCSASGCSRREPVADVESESAGGLRQIGRQRCPR